MNRRQAAYSLMELMVACTVSAVVLTCVFSGLITLQHCYAASEQYSTGLADQTRLLDSIAMDLRRAIRIGGGQLPGYTMLANGMGININVPDYYAFDPADPRHFQPLAVNPAYDPVRGGAFYSSGATTPTISDGTPYRNIFYYFYASTGTVTRSDPWSPLVPDGSGGYQLAPPTVLATNMTAFPIITADPNDPSGNTLCYSATFRSTFQPLTTATTGTEVTLHHVIFIRNRNLFH